LTTTVRADKTLWVRFDLNDYSVPPQALGRMLTLVASPTRVRLLDGAIEIAYHPRSYDRHELVEEPTHHQALLEQKRNALGSTPSGRLATLVRESPAFLQAAFERGESTARLATRYSARVSIRNRPTCVQPGRRTRAMASSTTQLTMEFV
jgi:hypothetical protein